MQCVCIIEKCCWIHFRRIKPKKKRSLNTHWNLQLFLVFILFFFFIHSLILFVLVYQMLFVNVTNYICTHYTNEERERKKRMKQKTLNSFFLSFTFFPLFAFISIAWNFNSAYSSTRYKITKKNCKKKTMKWNQHRNIEIYAYQNV